MILDRRWAIFGYIAEAHVDFEMKFGETTPVPAVNIFQLLRAGGCW
jgi:hypothetical protein